MVTGAMTAHPRIGADTLRFPVHPDAGRALAAHLGREGRRFVVEHFSVDRMVSTTEALYLELLARKQRELVPASI